MRHAILAVLLVAIVGIWPAVLSGRAADSTNVDKSKYTLFNPTPREVMREFTTDRPDKTESPYTVDAGHFQVELDLITYAHDHETSSAQDVRVNAWSVVPVNFKVGLLNWMDLQTVIESYNHSTIEDSTTGQTVRQSGFGDVTSRIKANLWGNDGGPTALAVLPFVKFPTSQEHLGNNSVEGGVIFPLAVELPAGFDLGFMTEFDYSRDVVGSGYHMEFVNSVTISHDLVGKLAGYLEFFSAVRAETDLDWVGTVDLGLTYGLTENIQLDAGVNIGVTSVAADVNPFLGISFRF
ncbi:MAG TPA: transporter [Verrucomicrobiae bacterium]|nr:transporter [Verrucomicrobiae bacterium]